MSKANPSVTGDFSAGTVLNDRYRITKVIGRGGLSTVYSADDLSLGRTVALKVLSGSLGDADDARRHQDEVRLIAGFDHPGLVTLFDFVSINGGATAMLVMQYVDGVTAADRIKKGALSAELTAEIGVDVAAALAHIHERGVIHRDVKPANILLPKDQSAQTAMLADFGIARLVDDGGITSTGMIVGTANYLSPEQATGAPLGPPTDIYSLGLVLLECLTGERAFPGAALESVAARLSADPPVTESVPPEWRELLTAMTARKPADRPTAGEALQSLRALAGGTGSTATLLMPSQAGATTELLAPAGASAAATELLSETPRPAPTSTRRPVPIGRILLILAGVAVTAFIVAFALQQLGSVAEQVVASPTSTASETPTPTPEPVVYPQVDGELGEHLADLQSSVATLDSEEVTAELQPLVLAVSELSAAADFAGASDALDSLQRAVDNAALSASERDAIEQAIDDVRSDLDDLIDENGKGKGNKPPRDD